MNRLTNRDTYGKINYESEFEEFCLDNNRVSINYVLFDKIYKKLAEYEDTGLEPEKVLFLKGIIESTFSDKPDFIEYLRDLVKADKDGRLVVLPCKVGETVYTTRWWEDVSEVCTDSKGEKFRRIVSKHKVTKEKFSPFSLDYTEFGKQVFLTKEEARDALLKMDL